MATHNHCLNLTQAIVVLAYNEIFGALYLIFAWTVSESKRLIGQGTVGAAASVFEGPGSCVELLLFP